VLIQNKKSHLLKPHLRFSLLSFGISPGVVLILIGFQALDNFMQMSIGGPGDMNVDLSKVSSPLSFRPPFFFTIFICKVSAKLVVRTVEPLPDVVDAIQVIVRLAHKPLRHLQQTNNLRAKLEIYNVSPADCKKHIHRQVIKLKEAKSRNNLLQVQEISQVYRVSHSSFRDLLLLLCISSFFSSPLSGICCPLLLFDLCHPFD
jgi:hypothetical protein